MTFASSAKGKEEKVEALKNSNLRRRRSRRRSNSLKSKRLMRISEICLDDQRLFKFAV